MKCIEEGGDDMTQLGHKFRRVWVREDAHDHAERMVEDFTVTHVHPDGGVNVECVRTVTPKAYATHIDCVLNFEQPPGKP